MKKNHVFILIFAVIAFLFAQNIKYIVDPKTCIGCTLCVQKCPVKAIEMKNNKAVIDAAKCIGCGLCASACPVKAISQVKPEVKAIPDSLKKTIPDSLKMATPDSLDKKNLKKDKTELKIPQKASNIAIVETKSEKKTELVQTFKTVYKVDVNCIGCKICIGTCPVKAIEYKSNTAIIDPSKCIACGLCSPVCPAKSIAKSEIVVKGS